MSVASLLPPTIKSKLRPSWHRFKKFAAPLTNYLGEMGVQTRVRYMQVKRAFIPAKIPAAAGGKLNLHLGCGRVDHKEFINIDGYPFPNVHYVQSLAKLPQFADESVDLIYASHCLEHFSYRQTEAVLSEWFRVLKKGGTLRISVPDFDKLVDIYTIHRKDPDLMIGQLMGGQDYKYNYHFTVLNEVNLSRKLETVGFRTLSSWIPGSEPLTTFQDFSIYQHEIAGRSHEISLNIQATK